MKKIPTQKAIFTRPTTASPNLSTSRNGFYNTGISEADIEKKAIEDGQAGILDPATVGENSHPHAIDGLEHGHEAASGLISHDARHDLDPVDATVEKELFNFESTKAAALDANSVYESAERERILQWAHMKVTGLPVPSKRAGIILAAAMVGLFVGDWGLITLGYQVLGLSDHPWIPGLGFTDDLHLAAFSSVFALVVLGEAVGDRLRRIEYALENSRRVKEAPDHVAVNAKQMKRNPPLFDVLWLLTCLLGALAGLFALSNIRSEYLKAIGNSTGGVDFFLIQLTILLAAIGLGFAYTNPEAKRWKSVDKKATAAEAARTTALDAHMASGSRINAAIDHRDSIIAKAGHHISTNAANARGQASAYARRYLLSQLEPAQAQLFADRPKWPSPPPEELLKQIAGVEPIVNFEKKTHDAVSAALTKTRTNLDTLRARIDQVQINKLNLPSLEETDLPEPNPDPAPSPMAPETASTPPLRSVREPAPVDEIDADADTDTDEETA